MSAVGTRLNAQKRLSTSSMKDTDSPPSAHERLAEGPLLTRRHGRHTTRACAVCRRRKTKCDGVEPTCGTCTVQGQECVWSQEPDKRRTRDTTLAIEDLREKVARLERRFENHTVLVDPRGDWRKFSYAIRVEPADNAPEDGVDVTCIVHSAQLSQMLMPGRRLHLTMQPDVKADEEDQLASDAEDSTPSP